VTFFNAFALSFGLLLAGLALIAAWIFRTAAAPMAAKLAVPALLVALGCLTPYEINSMLGMPRMSALAALPDRSELIAFVAHDEDNALTYGSASRMLRRAPMRSPSTRR
jgi:hypothetical protein